MRILISLFVALLLIGCGSQQAKAPASQTERTPSPDTTRQSMVEVSFARDIQSIVSTSCMPCHSDAGTSKSKWTTYAGVMSAVVAGKPDSSRFYEKLKDGRMPPSGKLDSARIALVYNWISEGAKNN